MALGEDPRVVARVPSTWRYVFLAMAATPFVAAGSQVALNAVNEKGLTDGFGDLGFDDGIPSIAGAGLELTVLLAMIAGARFGIYPWVTGKTGHISSVAPRTITTRGKDIAV